MVSVLPEKNTRGEKREKRRGRKGVREKERFAEVEIDKVSTADGKEELHYHIL